MPRNFTIARLALACAVATALIAPPSLADKPAWAGGKHEGRDDDHAHGKGNGHRDRDDHARFEERHHAVVREYYVKEYGAGRCPPGLAKKHNGCMPPGQAKKWNVGRPLPREVVYYDLPPALVVQIGTPPPGYRYVRVAADILLIAAGTGLVVDAIQDLGRR
jgi:Ni/Co efflux regulator RcnB